MAKVLSVNISEKKGVVKTPVERVQLQIDEGIVGDAHAANWHRQVSLLGMESIEHMKAQGLPQLKAGDFAENITTEGVVLYELPIGAKLKIGTTEVEVTQIGKECHSGCAIKKTVGDCVMPREGIFVKVLVPGWVQAGDEIAVVE